MAKQHKVYKFISDPGHGWLRVPHEDVEELNLVNRITKFSYLDDEFFYLEEDYDANLFIDAYKKEYGGEPDISFSKVKGRAFIRGLPRFTTDNHSYY